MRLAVLARRETNDALFALAKVLRAELASVVSESSTPVYIGIGCFHPPADNALTLISRAEKACAQASEQDDGGIGVYQPLVPDGSDSERDVPLVALVEEALRCDGFHLVYQPIMTLRGEKGERYETSLRLRAPDGEYVSALDFLPAARRARLMPAVDRWVMEHALDRLEEEANGQRRLRLFVWQTMETLGSDEFIPWFRSQIVARDLIKGPPILQVSLDTLSDNREIGSIRFRELRRLAVKTCLNLSEEDLRVLDLIGELGIALVRIPLPDAGALDAPRLTQFIERLHEREVQVIVAGIEDPQAIARVFACGVDFVQGNFLQLPSEELCFDFGEAALD
jgi:EAL domain-containing protein (putative c-di-GMP-specific phosphodiesterase class I)